MQKKEIFTTETAEATEAIGEKLAAVVTENGYNFIALYGDLGAGKTAFVRGVARVFCPNADVRSPTFSIINEYRVAGRTVLIHVDAYRIHSDDDLYSTGFYDLISENGIITVVEWSENIPYAIPKKYVRVQILRGKNEDDRVIEVEFFD